MNKVFLIGNLTKNPDVVTEKDFKVANFTVAVNKGEDAVDFIPCKAFNKTAELIDKFVKKGNKIGIVGSFSVRQYDYKGEKRTEYCVTVNEVDFLTPKQD